MELEKQVCGLELAKRLKELGVKQESLYYWVNDGTEETQDWTLVKSTWTKGTIISAFTVAELGEKLYQIKDKDIYSQWNCIWKYWQAFLLDENCNEEWQTHADTEADARAKMLIYLLENKLLEVVK